VSSNPTGKSPVRVEGSRLIRWRNRLLASHRFRSLVQKTPFLRRVARNNANQLFGMVSGFVHSQVLLALVELEILDQLETADLTSADLAELNQVPHDRMRVLLEAAKSLKLVQESRSGHYLPGPLGAVLASDPGIQAMIRHHQALYRDLTEPVTLLRNPETKTKLSRFWAYASEADASRAGLLEVSDYTGLMGASQAMVSEQILGSWSPKRSQSQSLLDVGGGDGHFLQAVATRHKSLRLGLFDLPAVVDIASERLGKEGLDQRVALYPGDFHRDPMPRDYSTVSLVRILHDHDDDQALALLKNIRQSIRPGGELLVAEPLKETRGAEQMGGAYFGLYLLAMGSGRPRSLAELTKLIKSAGFSSIRNHKTDLPLVCSVITAE